MEVLLTESQAARLSEIAAHEGRSVGEVLVDAATSVLQVDAHHWEAVDRALAQAARGEFIEEDEMDVRITKLLESMS